MKYIHSKVCRLRLLSAGFFFLFFSIQILAQKPVRPDTTQLMGLSETAFTHVVFHQVSNADSTQVNATQVLVSDLPPHQTTHQVLERETITVRGVSFNMVKVKGGTFTMGATEEQGEFAQENEFPAIEQTVDDYWIGETEVTQALWEAVMGSNPSYYRDPNLPVALVTWNDCQVFIANLNELTGFHFRLPSEAEWEFAARGGNLSNGYTYSGSDDYNEVAWIFFSGSSTPYYSPQPVATKLPNEIGLYDMSSNVWEWVQDWFGEYCEESQINPKGPDSGELRVIRGGGADFNAWYCRVSSRGTCPPGKSWHLGLRLAL